MQMSPTIILNAAEQLMRSVFDGESTRAEARLDLGGKGEGYCLELIVRPLTEAEENEADDE